jgi:tetratricopeptide (TPR) repeat protein
MVWPVHLRIDYSPGEIVASTGFGLRETVGLAIAIALIAAIIVTWRRAPVVAFGLLWFVISLLPVSNVLIPTGVLLAERTLFLPSIGFLLALGGATEYALRNAMISTHRREIAIAAAALALAAVARSVSRQRIWHDPQTLALASVRDAPRSWRVQRAYGETLFDAGKAADGIQAYARSIQWAPEPWFVRNSLSRRLRQLGDDAGAVGQLHESLRQRPGQREATAELAAALLGLGHYAEARRLADSVIVADNAPPIMVWLRRVADSAAAAGARPGSIKVGVRSP